MELYLPNYLVSANKPFSYISAQENNATTAYIYANASLWSNTAAVTSLTLTSAAGNIDTGSSFYLYGLKSS